MGGGLMQLVAYGAQDIYLTGNPQITFFKVVYRRHTNFSMEAIQQVFDGTTDFGNTVSATISRNGDLIHRMYLEHDASFEHANGTGHDERQVGNVEHYGHSLIKSCEIEIGGQRIDKHTSMWNRVYSDLTEYNPSGYFGATVGPGNTIPSGNGTLYQLMTGNGYGLNTGTHAGGINEFSGCADGSTGTVNGFTYLNGHSGDVDSKITVNKIFLPLNFWFCRNPGLALPLIALQYHEVKVKMTFETMGNLIRSDEADGESFHNPSDANTTNVTPSGNFNLWCDYIYLDTDERRRFAQVSHEYLIEQLQYLDTSISSASPTIKLNFNHPVKELIWIMRNTTGVDRDGGRHQALNTTGGDATSGPVSLDQMGGNWKLKLNGHDRFKERDTKYFTRTQVWQHHTGYGGVPTIGNDDSDLYPEDVATVGGDSIAVYSFALKPEEHQPSGACNFSRIDNAQLVGNSITVATGAATQVQSAPGTTNAATVSSTIFAVNYNVLRIMSGMGGLAYSN